MAVSHSNDSTVEMCLQDRVPEGVLKSALLELIGFIAVIVFCGATACCMYVLEAWI
jgi:hypothetical protein